MLKILHTIYSLAVILNLAAANNFSDQENYTQNALKNLVVTEIDNNAEVAVDTKDIKGKSEKYSRTKRKVQEMHLKVKNPTFRELTLVIKKDKRNNRPKCINYEFSGKCDIGRTTNARSENYAEIKENKHNINQTTHNDNGSGVKIYEDELNAHRNIVDHLKKESKSNAIADHELRCEGKDCSSYKYRSDIVDDNNDKDTLSNDTDDVIDFEQEAINDWALLSKGKEDCSGDKCDTTSDIDNTDKSKNKESLRKPKESGEFPNFFGYNYFEFDLIGPGNAQTVLREYDLIGMFEKLRKAYIEKLMWYSQDSQVKNLANFNSEKGAAVKPKTNNIYQNILGKISDNSLSEAVRGNLKNFINNKILPHDLNNNEIYVSRDFFEELKRLKHDVVLNEKMGWHLRMKNMFPRTKRQKLKLSRLIKFHSIY